MDRDEVHGLPEGPTLHRDDPVPHLQAETRWRVHVQSMGAFLVPFELLDVPEILSLHDDRVLHLRRDDDALEHLTANREPPVEGTLHVRADLARHGDVDPDVPPTGRGRRARGRGLSGPSLLLRHRGSPGLLHAVFRTEPAFLAVDLEAALNLKAEATPMFRYALLIALNLEHEGVAGLVDDSAPHMGLARVRGVQDLDLEADELVFPQVHSGLLRRGLGRRSRGARAPLLLGHDRQDARDVFPEGPNLSGIRRGAAHRGDTAFVHELIPELRQLLRDRLRVHGPDLLRAKQGH